MISTGKQACSSPGQEMAAGGLDPVAWQSIRRKARRLVAREPFARWEHEDVEQELAIWLWRALSTYDPALGSRRAFMSTILHRAAATLARARRSRRSPPEYGPSPSKGRPCRPGRLDGRLARCPSDARLQDAGGDPFSGPARSVLGRVARGRAATSSCQRVGMVRRWSPQK